MKFDTLERGVLMRTTNHDPAVAPAAVGGYSQAVELAGAQRILLVSGQIPEHPESGVPEGFDAQCRQAWRKPPRRACRGRHGRRRHRQVDDVPDRPLTGHANGQIRREMLPAAARPALTVVVIATLDPA